MGDPELAKFYRETHPKPPVENIVETDVMATALNRSKLGDNFLKRVVILACGHREITTNKKRAPCRTCHKMMLDGEDYEAFRNRSV